MVKQRRSNSATRGLELAVERLELENQLAAVAKEMDAARQALWDTWAALGFDTDGDKTPSAVVGLNEMVVRDAKEYRAEVEADYDALAAKHARATDLISALQRQLAAALEDNERMTAHIHSVVEQSWPGEDAE